MMPPSEFGRSLVLEPGPDTVGFSPREYAMMEIAGRCRIS